VGGSVCFIADDLIAKTVTSETDERADIMCNQGSNSRIHRCIDKGGDQYADSRRDCRYVASADGTCCDRSPVLKFTTDVLDAEIQ
jgi:predicted ABC-type ATPase